MSTHAFKTSIRTESQTKRTTNYYYDNDCNVMETHSPSLHFILQCSRGYLNKLHSSVEWNFRQKCNLSDKNKKKPHRFYLCNGLPSSSGNNLNYFPSWSKAGSYLAGKTLRRLTSSPLALFSSSRRFTAENYFSNVKIVCSKVSCRRCNKRKKKPYCLYVMSIGVSWVQLSWTIVCKSLSF